MSRTFVRSRTFVVPLMVAAMLSIVGLNSGWSDELSPPVRMEAAGKPIDTDVGHAAPFVGDFDGDGKLDLLVGQFGEGSLSVYRNIATNERPVFAAAERFMAGGKEGRVPTG